MKVSYVFFWIIGFRIVGGRFGLFSVSVRIELVGFALGVGFF